MKLTNRSVFVYIVSIILIFIAQVSYASTIEIGKSAPDFTLSDQANQKQSLSQMRGKWLVLYFYPKDETPGCIAEACSFRDDIVAIKAKNTVVWGVSVDNTESHAEFSRKHQLPFTLLADPGGTVAKKYDSLRNLLVLKIAKRNSFIIDPKGNIAKIYRSVNPKIHVDQILKDLQLLQSKFQSK